MQFDEMRFPDALPVDSYGPGFFRVGGQVIQGALLILPDSGVRTWRGFEDTALILAEGKRLDVLFVGMGAEMAYLPVGFRAVVEDAGIAVEPMPTPAACRTYNVLLSEGRRVGIALNPV
ncbi:Mth938-like domain-containing protein [Rubellimicrobium arenae]|uniref:Mth938-like domain-containing protein n=1 Tax=Rubellimicrobium arenae TaxID=2817372 RepID=UPI001B314BEC|nr:Mth938-like domain-containing protein [Rubellimicrobium arenae]